MGYGDFAQYCAHVRTTKAATEIVSACIFVTFSFCPTYHSIAVCLPFFWWCMWNMPCVLLPFNWTYLPLCFLSSLRCVTAPIIYTFLPFIPRWLRWSLACVLCWPTLRGVVPGLGALCSWCSSVPAGGASGCWVPGETGRSARQTSRSVIVQVPAWLTKGRAVSTYLLECSPDARSVWPRLRLEYGTQAFRTYLHRKLRVCSSMS